MLAGIVWGCGAAVSCNLRGNETVPVELRIMDLCRYEHKMCRRKHRIWKAASEMKKPGAGRAFGAFKFCARHIASGDRLTSRALQSDAKAATLSGSRCCGERCCAGRRA